MKLPCYSVTGDCVSYAACSHADGCMYAPREGNILNNPSNCLGCGKPARMTGKRVQERCVLVCDFCGHVHPFPSIKPMKEIVMKEKNDSYNVNIVGCNIGSISIGGGIAKEANVEINAVLCDGCRGVLPHHTNDICEVATGTPGTIRLRAYKNPNFNQFGRECTLAGFEVEHYEGRSFYRGPAVRVQDNDERLAVIRATTVPLQWDNMGKTGYVVYPMV